MPNDTISFKLDKSLHTGDTLYLEADTKKYLSRMGPTAIEASKDGIDQYCAFTVTVVSPTEIALQADTKKYLSRMGATAIEASKDGIDQYCHFVVVAVETPVSDDHLTIALQADTKKYLSRMGPTAIEASKDGIDQYCRFRVRTLAR